PLDLHSFPTRRSSDLRLFELVLEQKLSVRQTEDLARQAAGGQDLTKKAARPKLDKPADLRTLETTLEHALGTKVEIQTGGDLRRDRKSTRLNSSHLVI